MAALPLPRAVVIEHVEPRLAQARRDLVDGELGDVVHPENRYDVGLCAGCVRPVDFFLPLPPWPE
jgi:hypothetical protein